MLSEALETVTPTLRDVTHWIGAQYHTVRAYAAGQRGAPPAVLRELAKALRQHAKQVQGAADRLDAQAERDENPT